MRYDLISTKKIFSPFFSCPQDINKFLETLFIKNRPYSNILKRLLIINSPDCLDPTKDEEYNAIVDKYTVKRMIDEGYIRLNPKIARGTHEEIKSYIIITQDNFSQNKRSSQYRDYIINMDIVCYNDAWVLNELKVRPLMICGYIDGILNSLSDETKDSSKTLPSRIKLTGIGYYKFLGCNLVVLNEDISMYTLSYLGQHFTEDLGEEQVD